ncbi:MAG: radical SAM protein [Desulfobacula sp.]|jgi:radical SAM superfamily enzyme YgiQ (UPF0313 family)
MGLDKHIQSKPMERPGSPYENSLFQTKGSFQTKRDKLKIVLVPKLTNPFICRFFNPRYSFDTGVLALGSYVRNKTDVTVKSIFGHLKKKYLTRADMIKISSKKYLNDYINYILGEAPDIVGISCLDTSLLNTIVLSKAIKKHNKNIKIILGGPGIFYNYADLMTHFSCIDYCIIGEGEIALDGLIDYFNGNMRIDQVPGLAYREKGLISRAKPTEFVDINDLPYLCLDLYDIPADSLESMACETGRGCPYKCTFCSTTDFWGNCFRVKDPERIAREIEYYCTIYKKISHFDFHSHDNFLTHKNHIKKLYSELEKRNLHISWNCSSRIDHLDDEFIELLKKSGCNYIDCGPESGSSRIRKLINKNINYKATITNIKKLVRHNIGVAVNFMFGFPTETIEELEKTFEQACRSVNLKADIVFCFLSPIKGTKIYEQFEHLLINKAEDHLHDFTNARANYLFGTKALCSDHPYFKTRAKMFSNGKTYDAVVEKIRGTDSVHIFTHFSSILPALKQKLKINIHESKAAMTCFPYSEDLFRFAQKKVEKTSFPLQSKAEVLYKAVQIQQKNNQAAQFEDITFLVLLDQMICQQDIFLPQFETFKQKTTNDFFKDFSGNNIFPDLLSIDDFQLCAAFKIPTLKTLFMKFNDPSCIDPVLTGITLDKNHKKNLVCYKKQMNDKEIRLLKNLKKIIVGEI